MPPTLVISTTISVNVFINESSKIIMSLLGRGCRVQDAGDKYARLNCTHLTMSLVHLSSAIEGVHFFLVQNLRF